MSIDRREKESYRLHIELGAGFRDHAVLITVDTNEVYRRTDVTTDPVNTSADALEVTTTTAIVRIDVSVAPGNLFASIACDTTRHRHVVVSLVGEATLNLETFA